MKYGILVAVFLGAGILLFLKPSFKKPPPPPPPPPPIEDITPPPPLIDAEQEKQIILTTIDQDPLVRWEAITLLDKLGSPKAFDIMFERLHQDPDLGLRLKIIARMAKEKDNPEITQNMVWATKDIDERVRIAALIGLRQIGDPKTAAAATAALQDTHDKVRFEALQTLNKLEDIRAEQVRAAAERKRKYEEAKAKAEAAGKK